MAEILLEIDSLILYILTFFLSNREIIIKECTYSFSWNFRLSILCCFNSSSAVCLHYF